MPEVTIAINTYNRISFLSNAIQGVLNQTFEDFELLILDNGSTDSTKELVENFKDPRIIYYKNDVNRRNFYNYAFFVAKGKYLVITHDDDIMHPEMIRKEYDILSADSEISCVSVSARQIDFNGKQIFNVENKDNLKDVILSKDQYLEYFLSGNSICAPTVMFRIDFFRTKSLIFKHDIAGLACDQYLWYKTLEYDTKIYIHAELLYNQRIHKSQDSVENGINMNIELLFIFLNEASNQNSIYKTNTINTIIDNLYHFLSQHNKYKIKYSENELINLFNLNYKRDVLVDLIKIKFFIFIKWNLFHRVLKKIKIF